MSTEPTPSHALVTAKDAKPDRWVLFLHGILGSGANWRTIARRFVAERPTWGACLVDLRKHGASQRFEPPHTVDAAARDLERIELPVRAVLGHSFGGKVGLAFAQRRTDLERLFLIDSNPGARPDARGSEGTLAVVDMLRDLPKHFPTRQAFLDAVLSHGHPLALAQWLAMNVEREGDGFCFALDMEAIRALLDDYFRSDLWSVLESPSAQTRIVVINGGRSNVWDANDQARLREIAKNGRVEPHVIAGAGHWVHADAPDELVSIVVASTPA